MNRKRTWLGAAILTGALAVVAVYAHAVSAFRQYFAPSTASAPEKTGDIAQACKIDPQEKPDDIFFLTCGGIY